MAIYQFKGACTSCGMCCRSTLVPREMLQTNNVIDGVLYCDGAYKNPDGTFGCTLVDQILKYVDIEISHVFDPTLVSDDVKIASGLTKEQVNYCLQAVAFPNFNADVPPYIQRAWFRRLLTKRNIEKCGFYAELVG